MNDTTPALIIHEKRRRTRSEAERAQYRKPGARSAKTGRKCIYTMYPGTDQERPCGRSTRKNWFFCKAHHGLVDDYNGEAIC